MKNKSYFMREPAPLEERQLGNRSLEKIIKYFS
jgi:hypothetical protein